MTDNLKKVFENLERNNIMVVYAENSAAAVAEVEKMLFDGCVITAGGSMSLKQSGVWQLIEDKRYDFRDRSAKDITPEQQQECFRSSIGADFFFCSANAITEDGEIVNVDGLSNRVSAVAFGPKKVVIVAGINKIVPDLDAAFLRVKQIAAPKNTIRLGVDTPCARLGHCVSLLKTKTPAVTDGCQSKYRICCNYTVNAYQREKGRITVILVNEELGY